MDAKDIKSKIKEYKSSDESDAIKFFYPEIEGGHPIHIWNGLRKLNFPVRLKPKVGDIVIFRKYYRGNSVGDSIIGVVSKVTREGFTYLVDQREVKARYNFGDANGYVVEGFISPIKEEPKEDK